MATLSVGCRKVQASDDHDRRGRSEHAPREPRHRAREAAAQMLYQWRSDGRRSTVVETFWLHDQPDSAGLADGAARSPEIADGRPHGGELIRSFDAADTADRSMNAGSSTSASPDEFARNRHALQVIINEALNRARSATIFCAIHQRIRRDPQTAERE
jgi:transcription termination factor NusB